LGSVVRERRWGKSLILVLPVSVMLLPLLRSVESLVAQVFRLPEIGTVEADGGVAVGDYADADAAAAWIDDLFGDAGGAASNSPAACMPDAEEMSSSLAQESFCDSQTSRLEMAGRNGCTNIDHQGL
jgi:hypothetical protein